MKKKTVKKSKVTHTHKEKKGFSATEKKHVLSQVSLFLDTPQSITPEEFQGVVISATNKSKGGFTIVGGRRNMSDILVMQVILEVLNMTPMEGASLLARLYVAQRERDPAKNTKKSK